MLNPYGIIPCVIELADYSSHFGVRRMDIDDLRNFLRLFSWNDS